LTPRLFERGRSTKPEGMGVGLAICRRILADHGGDIWAEPGDQGGAKFCFVLPLAAAEAQQKAA
jgi:signal transduction histidine kinase